MGCMARTWAGSAGSASSTKQSASIDARTAPAVTPQATASRNCWAPMKSVAEERCREANSTYEGLESGELRERFRSQRQIASVRRGRVLALGAQHIAQELRDAAVKWPGHLWIRGVLGRRVHISPHHAAKRIASRQQALARW